MLGRRRSRSAPDAIDITERIRRRALDRQPVEPGAAANDSSRFPPARATGDDAPGPRGRPAKLLSFSQTPVYRLKDNAPVDAGELRQVLEVLTDRLEAQGPLGESRPELEGRIGGLIGEVLDDLKLRLNGREQTDLIDLLVDELIGLGAIERLLADETVSEIRVNGPGAISVQRRGRRQVTDMTFRNGSHLKTVVKRIAARAGRRIHEHRPMVDVPIAEDVWADILVPPLAMSWPSITIRKGVGEAITLDRMVRQGCLSADVAGALQVALRCRLNVVISGASESGKTTLLRALSKSADPVHRIVTVEDIGELRGGEAVDMMTTMAASRDPVLATLRAERPREALGRLEILASATGPEVSAQSCRAQVARAVDLIVQIERMADGERRVTRVTEIVGAGSDTIVTEDLFAYEQTGRVGAGRVEDAVRATGLKARFLARISHLRGVRK
jgi:pilus assembly protein CpaF